jgi:signal transduction histidine kinase
MVDDQQRHALVRLAREAVSNGIRHGKAERIRVEVGRDADRRRLVVVDDGTGFDPESTDRHSLGFGLRSMRERAAALPGRFSLDSCPGKGTKVKVTW